MNVRDEHGNVVGETEAINFKFLLAIDGMTQRCRNGWYPSRPPTFYSQQPAVDEHARMKRRGSTVVGPFG